MAKLLRTPQADVDLTDIWTYIARENPAAADKLIRKINDTFELLATNPEIGIRQDELRPGLRCKPVRKNYLVFYEVASDDIRILRVMHGARKYEDLL